MYQINKPIRIVEQENGMVLVNVPRVELSVKVNKNVIEFLEFLGTETTISKDSIKKYTSENDILNVEDYEKIFDKFVDCDILLEL